MKSLKAFTVVEVLAAIALVVFLTMLLLPLGQRSINQARSVQCLSNLRQMGGAALQYAMDNNGKIPPAYLPTSETDSMIFYRLLNQYLGPCDRNSPTADYPKVYRCPAHKHPFLDGTASYGCNISASPDSGMYSAWNIFSSGNGGAPPASQVILYMDADSSALRPEWGANYSRVAFRHNGFANAVMMDGSATRSFSDKEGLLEAPLSKNWGTP